MRSVLNISDKGNFEGGYFIPNKDKSDISWLNTKNLFVTLSYHNTIKQEVIDMIRNSKSSIKLCSFILTDKEIFNEIEKVLKETEVAVFILTQLDQSKFSTSLLSEEEMVENFSQIHLDILKKLYSNGAHVRATKTAHAKFIISDRKKALLTSANITSPSLTKNPETGIYLNTLETLNHLDELFNEIFQNGTEYTRFLTANSNKQFIVSSENKISEEASVLKKSSKLKFTFENLNHSLYGELVRMIENSDGDIYISTYSIVGLDSLPEFINAVKSKIEQGISIFIFSRGMNHRTDHLHSCTKLTQIGCKIYGDVLNHSKGIITPSEGMIFTANIDGNHGLKNGFEVGAILENEQKIDMESFIKWQIESAPYIFMLTPKKESYFSYYSYHCTEKEISPLRLPKNLEIRLHNSTSEVANLINVTPCYLKLKNKEIARLQIGKNIYKAFYKDGILNVHEKIHSREFNLESYLLKYSNAKIIF